MNIHDVLEERLNNHIKQNAEESRRICAELANLSEVVATNTTRMEQAIMGLRVFMWLGSTTIGMMGVAISFWRGWIG